MFKQIGLKVGHWSHKKIVDPLLQILRRGAEPKQLAFSGALGVTLGIFPIVGVPVFMCGLAIAVLGSSCHAPTVFLANFIATPVELSLVIPFLRLGEAVSGGSHFALTSDALKKVLTGQASWEVLLSIFHALLGWLVATPFILAGLYVLFLPCFTLLVRKFSSGQPIKINSVPSSPKKIVSSSPKKAVQPLTEVRVKVRDV
ncbi:uncharacterized protein LOC107816181 isoform X1 [Nicotiana tabacum]|uniref:Uncharacterized protein LOC107816181 isoform X1 n=1 Tax=Nicotiana tabacum TaxID=4097 RepID=A0A1S4C8C3_TOBAC|nr:uncharacterized protein LOC104097613 isoform X1 [Nicotiana tomentosiformis]XP_016497361.1 PREDICTED: uncharacterized protein LOC107816181 isoform X1 [Nicotiana tabacum]